MATFKRSLAMILCVMMLLTATPLTALAEEAGTDSQEPVVETQDIVVNETEPSEEVEQPEEAAQPEAEVQTAAVSATDVVKVVDGEGNETGYKSLQAAFDGFAPGNNTYGGTYVITLLGDTSGVTKNLQYPTSPLDITLDLNGHTITGNGSSIAVYINFGAKSSAGCVFTIKDSSGNNSGKITGGKGGVKLDGKGSTLNFMGGTITGNHGASQGGGILMGATAYLHMTGGVITGNSVSGSTNRAGIGGGIMANYATISGGLITGNTAGSRGGGISTDITRTSGYSTLIIANGVVYGNTAGVAGDDVMAQGNGMSSTKFSFSIGTENWFVDGWNGKKASAGNGEQPRYSADNAVAYTDGGWVNQYNKSIGLKYVPAAEPEKPVAPEAPTSSYDVSLFDIVCEYANYTLRYSPPALPAAYYSIGDVYEENGEYFCDITVALKAFWEEVEKSYWDDIACKDTDHAYVDEFPEEVAIKFVWNAEAEKWDNAEELKVYTITCAPVNVTPEAPTVANVNPSQTLISAVCDRLTGKGHEQIWYFHDGAIIETGEVAQDDNGLWTCVITFDAVKYVETFNELTKSIHGLDIVHELTDPTQTTVTATLVWNAETEQWDISVPGVIHTVCKNPVTGTITRAYLRSDNGRIYTDLLNVSYNESVALELYSGDKLLTTAVLNASEYPGPAVKKELTGSICVETYNDSDTWVIAEPWLPLDSQMPTEIRLVVDGVITDTCTLIKSSRNGEAMTQEDWINFPGTYAIGGKIGSVYTATNGMSADLSDVLAFTDVTVKVYSGDQLLTTVSDREGALTLGIYRKYLTVSVRTNGESSSWEATPWQPMDDVIPTKLELYIDGVLCDTKTFTLSAEKWAALPGTEARPEAPKNNGSNVTQELITILCNTEDGHAPKTYGWGDPAANFVFPKGSEPVWNSELNAWTISVRIESIMAYYVGLQFNKEYNGIQHKTVDGLNTIDTTLVWDAEANLWQTLTGKPFEVHTTCKTHPSAPTAMALKSYQVQVYGIVGGEEKLYAIYVDPASAIIGEIKGSREDGFTVDVTFNIAEDDYFQSGWLAKRDPNATVDDYTYDWSRTPESITITLKYNESTTGNLYGTRSGDWVLASNGKTYGAIGKAYMIPSMPASPEQQNVTDKLVTVICDSDGNRHQTVYGKWYPQHCKTTSDIVWNAELNAWTVDVRIGSLYIMYVNQLEDANNGTTHELTEDITTVYTTLVWDAAQELWMPKEAIELHTTCRTAPLAPIYKQLSSYQVKVWGNVIGKDASYTTSIPASGYTLSEVYGSREEGFFVDVTITLNDSDIYISNWIAKKAPEGITYGYDWDKTPQTVTFTLKYNGSLTGTLYGNRHAANTNYDWVLASTGKHYGVVTEAYAKPIPESATIVFRYWLGTNMGTFNQKLTYGEPLTLRANTFKRTGYTFDHWNSKRDTDDGKFTFTDGQTLTAEQVHELYLYALDNDGKAYLNAYWKANDYTLSFNVGYDAENPASKTVTYDSPVGELPVLTRKGYDFLGWLDAEGNEVTAETIYQVAGDSTLTANWKAHTFTIVYRYWLGTTMGSFNHTVSYDQVVTLRANSFKRHGYTFDHWNSKRDTDDGKFTFADCETLPVETVNALYDYAMANGGKAYLNAYWKANTFTIVYRYWLGTTMGSFNHTVSYDQVVTLRANSFKRHGYTFDHWNSKRDTDDGKFTFADCETLPVETVNALYDYAMANGGKAYLNAYWKANEYTVTLDPNGGKVDPATITVTYDAAIGELPVPTRKGYDFLGWLDAEGHEVTAETIYQIAGDSTLTANWENHIYSISVESNEGGKITVQPTGIFNEIVNISIAPDTGYRVISAKLVYESNGIPVTTNLMNATRFKMPSADVTVIVEFEQVIYSITVQAGEHGTIEVQDTAVYGVLVPMTVTPDEGYSISVCKLVYQGKNGTVTTTINNPTRFKMPAADVTLIVEFKANDYTLTLNPNGGKVDPATITVTYDAAIGELPVPTKVNSIFDGWYDADGNEVTPEVIYKTAGDSTITAKWIQYPGSSSTNVTKELFTIQCSVKHEHSWLCNWFGSHVSLVKDSVKWNEETGRWEAQAKIGSSMLSQINSTQPRKNYFGGITHHYDTTNYVFDLYYDPSVTGLNSQGKEVTGLWLPAQEYVVPVYCYTEPSMPDISKITATALWMRDAGNKLSTHSQKFTVKQLVEGSYTVGQMYTEGGKFYVKLTLTDLAPYIQSLGEKTGKTYVIGDWQNHLTLKDCTFTLVYTGSTTDYKQDGTGWSVDASSWNNNSEKLNGKSLWLTEQFTVTYTDGVEDKEIFADQVFTVNAYTENGKTSNAVTDFAPTATPAVEDPTRAGYIFAGWTPAVAETVTETVTYTANWIQHPGSSSTNVTKELFTIQCSVKHEHSWLCNWFGSHVSLVKDSVKWNEETGRWEAQAKIGSSMLSQINSTQPRKNYFGGITHHYDTTNYVFDLYYDPSVTGLNSQGKEVTGLWLPAQEYVVPVYCYTEPSMPDISKITATALWMRDAGNKLSTHSQKFTVKQLVEGSYTVGQMYTEGGKFYVNLTLTDLAPYIQALGEKTGKTYVIGDWQNHLTLKDCTFTLVYTGSTTDYKQDGTGWSVDASSWNNNSEKLNGKSLWLTEQFTVTYTDGVEDKEIFADQVFTVNAYTENGKTSNAVTDFAPTATPVVENLEYIGYTFTGWTPEWSETVTGNADYTATWSANTYTVSFNTNGGPEAEPKVVVFDSKYGNLPSSSLTGLSSRKTDWYLVDENGNVTDVQIKNTTVVSVARDHTLFLKRDVLAPTLKIALTVPGGISNDYKYYIPGNSTRVLTVTVSNMNAEVLDYTYQWFKDGTAIEGATEAVLTLPGNVSDSGTYKVVVTAKLKDGSSIVVMNDTASAEKEQKVQIMRAANTLRYNDNFGETPVTSDSYFGGATATLKRTVTRTGYTFTGWNTKADGTGENFANGDTVEFPGDNGNGGIVLELFAQWIANEYTVSFNTNGGPEAEPKVVVFDSKYGNLPSSSLTGLSSRKTDWYLVDENGNVTDVQIKNTTVVSVARDHTLFLKRDVLAPTLKIALTVPGGISNDYKYYIPGNSTRVLTVTVSNMNAEVLDYTYQWFKDGTAIEGATEAVLTLPGNVSDSGTYKVVVTAKLKDGSSIVVMNDTASAEKEQKVQIMRAANTLRYNDNFGETPVTSDSYFGGATATLKRTVTRTGYTFTGWNTKADGTGENFANGDTVEFPGDNGNGGIVLELFAQWIANEYEITLNSGEGYFETAALSETDAESAPLTSVTLKVTFGQPIGEMPTPVKRGYTFNGWFDAEGNLYTADTIYSIPGNLDLTAKFTVNTYKITWEINEWTVVDPMELTVTYGQTIGELPIPKLTYWKFCCWKDAAGNVVTGDTIYEWDEDIVLTAIWYARDMNSSSSSPKTGDASTAMMISVMALSAAGLVALILSDRKRRAAK